MQEERNRVRVNLGKVEALLLSDRAIWLPAAKTLVAGDLHFGKVNHFRRSGLPVPLAANVRNAERLIDLINAWAPSRMLFLGDLFHSAYNDDWEVIGHIVKQFSACSFELVHGNHDILSDQQYERKGIRVLEQERIDGLLFTHEPLDRRAIPTGQINLAGHLHPAARLVGKGRQSLTLPCFWQSANQLILPAFGTFTGLAVVRPEELDTVYVIVEDQIMELRPPALCSPSKVS